MTYGEAHTLAAEAYILRHDAPGRMPVVSMRDDGGRMIELGYLFNSRAFGWIIAPDIRLYFADPALKRAADAAQVDADALAVRAQEAGWAW